MVLLGQLPEWVKCVLLALDFLKSSDGLIEIRKHSPFHRNIDVFHFFAMVRQVFIKCKLASFLLVASKKSSTLIKHISVNISKLIGI